jgi:hypothetical protein
MDNPVVTFVDNQGRQIIIGGDQSDIVADHNNKEIGRFNFDTVFDEFSSADLLTNCKIETDYQRSGIGSEMMKLAEEWYGEFYIVNHFSMEGKSFMEYCRDNIFEKDHQLRDDDRF